MTGALDPSRAADLAQASIGRLDAVASAMERKWGINRLPKLVSASLAVRFRSQAERLDEAIRSNIAAAVTVQAEAMLRAWQILDEAAIATGWKPLAPTIWEITLPSTNEIIAIVRDANEAQALAGERKGAVWTLSEVAIAIEAFGETVRATKDAFPGANVTRVQATGVAGKTAIGFRAPDASKGQATKPVRKLRNEKRHSDTASFTKIQAPSPDPLCEILSTTPPIDWEHGDDIPF